MENNGSKSSDLILGIIDRLKDNFPDKKEFAQRLTAVEIEEKNLTKEIDEIKTYINNKEEKESDLKKFNFTKLLAIISLLIALISLVVNILEKIL